MTDHEPEVFESEAGQEIDEAERQARRENAKRVLQESGCAAMLRTLNREQLKGRGFFDEYDSGVIFKWGNWSTRRHVWVDIQGDAIRFRLLPHRKCQAAVPVCDGEYHTLLREHWQKREVLKEELAKNFARPVAEPSAD
ncbi:MAG TPA: hypothetical protein VH599_08105 [Ktedonobacterales bacterium]|jgi:hypothetical protein